MHDLWKFCIFFPLVERTNSSHVWICSVIAGNGFRIFLIASNSFVVNEGWAWRCIVQLRTHATSQYSVKESEQVNIRSAGPMNLKYTEHRGRILNSPSHRGQPPRILNFQTRSNLQHRGSCAGRFCFCLVSSFLWFDAQDLRIAGGRDHFWRWDMISYQSESHLSKLANHAWLPWNPDLRRRLICAGAGWIFFQ